MIDVGGVNVGGAAARRREGGGDGGECGKGKRRRDDVALHLTYN